MDEIERNLISVQIVSIGDEAIDSNDIFSLCEKISRFHPEEYINQIIECLPCMPLKVGIYSTMLAILIKKNDKLKTQVLQALINNISEYTQRDMIACIYWCRVVIALGCCYFYDFEYILNFLTEAYNLCFDLYDKGLSIKADHILYIVLSNFFYISKQMYDAHKERLSIFLKNCFELIDKRQNIIDKFLREFPKEQNAAYAYTLVKQVVRTNRLHDRLYMLKVSIERYLQNDLKSCATHRFYQKVIFQEAFLKGENKISSITSNEVEDELEDKIINEMKDDVIEKENKESVVPTNDQMMMINKDKDSIEESPEEKKLKEKELQKLIETCIKADHFSNIKYEGRVIDILEIDLNKDIENANNSHDVWIIQEHVSHIMFIYRKNLKLCTKILTLYVQLQSDFYNEVLINCIINKLLSSFLMDGYYFYVSLLQKLIRVKPVLLDVLLKHISKVLKIIGNIDNHSYRAFMELCCSIFILCMSENKRNKQKEMFYNRKRKNASFSNPVQLKRRQLATDSNEPENRRLKLIPRNLDIGSDMRDEPRGNQKAVLRTYEEGLRELHMKKALYSGSKEQEMQVLPHAPSASLKGPQEHERPLVENERGWGWKYEGNKYIREAKTVPESKAETGKNSDEDKNKKEATDKTKTVGEEKGKENTNGKENVATNFSNCNEKEMETSGYDDKEEQKRGLKNEEIKEDKEEVKEEVKEEDEEDEEENEVDDFNFNAFYKELESLDVSKNLKKVISVVYNVKKKYRLKWIKNFFFKCCSLLHKEGVDCYVPRTIINYAKQFEIKGDESHFTFWEFTVFKCLLKYSYEETMNMNLKVVEKKTEMEIQELRCVFQEKMNLLISSFLNFLNGKNRLNKVPVFFNNIRLHVDNLTPRSFKMIDGNFYNRFIAYKDFVRTNFIWNLYNATILLFKSIILMDAVNASAIEILFQNHAILFEDFKKSKFQNDVEREKFEMELINIAYTFYGRSYIFPLLINMMLNTKIVYPESAILFFFTKMDPSDHDNFYTLEMLYNVFDGLVIKKKTMKAEMEKMRKKMEMEGNTKETFRMKHMQEEIIQLDKQLSNFSVDTLYLFSENIMRCRRSNNSYMNNEMLKEMLAFARRYIEYINVDKFLELCKQEKVDEDLKDLLKNFKNASINIILMEK